MSKNSCHAHICTSGKLEDMFFLLFSNHSRRKAFYWSPEDFLKFAPQRRGWIFNPSKKYEINQSVSFFWMIADQEHTFCCIIVVILHYHLMACRKSIEPNHHILLLHGPCPVVSLRIQCMEYLDIECLASKGCKELIRSVLNQYVQPILSLHKNDLFRNAWSTCWQFNHTPLLEPTVMPSLSLSA